TLIAVVPVELGGTHFNFNWNLVVPAFENRMRFAARGPPGRRSPRSQQRSSPSAFSCADPRGVKEPQCPAGFGSRVGKPHFAHPRRGGRWREIAWALQPENEPACQQAAVADSHDPR